MGQAVQPTINRSEEAVFLGVRIFVESVIFLCNATTSIDCANLTNVTKFSVLKISHSGCPAYATNTETGCICNIGYFENGLSCDSCPAICLSCMSATICLTCVFDYYLDASGSCLQATLLTFSISKHSEGLNEVEVVVNFNMEGVQVMPSLQ